MTVDDIRLVLAGHHDDLLDMGVAALWVFGSTARGEAGPDSDIDLLVEFDRPIGLFHFGHVVVR